MREISVPLLNNAACSKASALYSVAEPQHIVAGVIALIAFNASGSGEEPGLYSACRPECERAARSKKDAHIEEMIADGGVGFHVKVKVSFLKPDMLIFLWKKSKHDHQQTV